MTGFGGHIRQTVNLLSLWVVFSPDPLELVKMMWPQDRPVTRQVVKVVHDDGHKQVDDLGKIMNPFLALFATLGNMLICCL